MSRITKTGLLLVAGAIAFALASAPAVAQEFRYAASLPSSSACNTFRSEILPGVDSEENLRGLNRQWNAVQTGGGNGSVCSELRGMRTRLQNDRLLHDRSRHNRYAKERVFAWSSLCAIDWCDRQRSSGGRNEASRPTSRPSDDEALSRPVSPDNPFGSNARRRVSPDNPFAGRPAATSPNDSAAGLYGALAIDERQGQLWGVSYNYPAQSDADRRALRECGSGCTVVLRFRACGAFAADQQRGSTVYGWGTAGTATAAQSIAAAECRGRGGSSCIVRAWGCNSRGQSPSAIGNSASRPPSRPRPERENEQGTMGNRPAEPEIKVEARPRASEPPPGWRRESMVSESQCKHRGGRYHYPGNSVVPVCDVRIQ